MRRFTAVIAPLFSSILFISATNVLAETCTEAQAFNKMFAINRAMSRMMAQGGAVAQTAGAQISMDSAPISALLGEKKYDEACAKYDALAQSNKIDIAKELQGIVTFEELQKDGGKRGGVCSQAEAHVKMMGIFQKVQDKVALGDADGDAFRKFSDETTKIGELMYTNPSEMCKRLDEIEKKFVK